MRKETVELDEVRGAGLRKAIEEHPQLVGLTGAINGRRVVGIVVAGDEPAAEAPEAAEPKARGRK
jgi:hypothetical protein